MLPRYLSDCLVELDHPKDVYMELCDSRFDILPEDWEEIEQSDFRLVGLRSYGDMEFDDAYALVSDVGPLSIFCEIDDNPSPQIYGPDGAGFCIPSDGGPVYWMCRFAKDVAWTIKGWLTEDD